MKKIVSLSVALLFLILAGAPVAHAEAKSGPIDLNKASVEELRALPRVGPALAQRIVEYREKNGSFHKVEEIINVRGIGESTFKLLRDKITVAASESTRAQAAK